MVRREASADESPPQMATKLVLEPIFEATFLPCSYGFRPKRSATMALETLRKRGAKGGHHVLGGAQSPETEVATCCLAELERAGPSSHLGGRDPGEQSRPDTASPQPNQRHARMLTPMKLRVPEWLQTFEACTRLADELVEHRKSLGKPREAQALAEIVLAIDEALRTNTIVERCQMEAAAAVVRSWTTGTPSNATTLTDALTSVASALRAEAHREANAQSEEDRRVAWLYQLYTCRKRSEKHYVLQMTSWEREAFVVFPSWNGEAPPERSRIRLVAEEGNTVRVCSLDLAPLGTVFLERSVDSAAVTAIVTSGDGLRVEYFGEA